jgi:hypothetical protein
MAKGSSSLPVGQPRLGVPEVRSLRGGVWHTIDLSTWLGLLIDGSYEVAYIVPIFGHNWSHREHRAVMHHCDIYCSWRFRRIPYILQIPLTIRDIASQPLNHCTVTTCLSARLVLRKQFFIDHYVLM